jgi:hypothetical protein
VIFLSKIEVKVEGFGRKEDHWMRNSMENPNMNFMRFYRQWLNRKIDFEVTGGKTEAGQDS